MEWEHFLKKKIKKLSKTKLTTYKCIINYNSRKLNILINKQRIFHTKLI